MIIALKSSQSKHNKCKEIGWHPNDHSIIPFKISSCITQRWEISSIIIVIIQNVYGHSLIVDRPASELNNLVVVISFVVVISERHELNWLSANSIHWHCIYDRIKRKSKWSQCVMPTEWVLPECRMLIIIDKETGLRAIFFFLFIFHQSYGAMGNTILWFCLFFFRFSMQEASQIKCVFLLVFNFVRARIYKPPT